MPLISVGDLVRAGAVLGYVVGAHGGCIALAVPERLDVPLGTMPRWDGWRLKCSTEWWGYTPPASLCEPASAEERACFVLEPVPTGLVAYRPGARLPRELHAVVAAGAYLAVTLVDLARGVLRWLR